MAANTAAYVVHQTVHLLFHLFSLFLCNNVECKRSFVKSILLHTVSLTCQTNKTITCLLATIAYPHVCNIGMVTSVCVCISECLGGKRDLLNKHKKRKNVDRNSTALVSLHRLETGEDGVLIKQPVGAEPESLHCLSLKTVYGGCLSSDSTASTTQANNTGG